MDEAFRDASLAALEDSEARAYFQRLAIDEDLHGEVLRFQDERLLPAQLANWTAFKSAFGEGLRIIEPDVPVVTGHEYWLAPERIVDDLRTFLGEVAERENGRRSAGDGSPAEPSFPCARGGPGNPGAAGTGRSPACGAPRIGSNAIRSS